MPKQLPTDKPDYYIEVRHKLKNGQWSDWTERGDGKWIGVEHMQKQVKMLRLAYMRNLQIKVIKGGKMLDYFGNETDKPIEYDERTR